MYCGWLKGEYSMPGAQACHCLQFSRNRQTLLGSKRPGLQDECGLMLHVDIRQLEMLGGWEHHLKSRIRST